MRPQPNPDSEPAELAADDPMASVHERLDGLTERLDRIARATLGEPLAAKPAEFDDMPDPVAEALARLDRRLDEMMAMSQAAAARVRRPIAPAPPKNTRAYWAEQIAARQRALDAPTPEPEKYEIETAPAPDMSGVEQQLKTVAALSRDLAEIGRALTQATPQREIEALQAEVRSLAQRIDSSRGAGAGAPDFSAIERELSQIRGVLGRLTPAENLAELETAVRVISEKIDRLGRSQGTPEDQASIGQLETAIASLRSVAATAASEATLAELTSEVRGLAAQFERITAEASRATLSRLESSIRELLSNERFLANDTPPENAPSPVNGYESHDRLALHAIDNRMALLTEKLDLTDERLGRLESVERGLADVLAHLKDIGIGGPPAAGAAMSQAQAASLPKPPEPISPPDARLQANTKSMPRGAARGPIDPNLPPDTPLEPGSGIPGSKAATSAATRIAASEAALRDFRAASAEPGSRSAAIAAARNAARAAYLNETSRVSSKPPSKRWLRWRSRKFDDEAKQPYSSQPIPSDYSEGQFTSEGTDPGAKLAKTALVASSVIIAAIAATHTTVELLFPDAAPPFLSKAFDQLDSPPKRSVATSEPIPSQSTAPKPDSEIDESVGSISGHPSIAAPIEAPNIETENVPSPPALIPLGPQATPPIAAANLSPATDNFDKLPPSIGPALRQAAAAKNSAALYELGVRFAEGRGVTQNMTVAAGWFERAAQAGFTPAQFRLASMIEKGEGVKKDPQAASRLYRTAADKGHAKAMHNLAVLYAEGLGGKPDYGNAAHWFRKAAAYGITDSQYNLGVLYARGIGVPINLIESYRWFALAASAGDQDAAKKRDSIAERLDSKSLAEAKLAINSFVAETEPEAATSLKAPPGGWDRAPAAQAKPKR